MPDFGFLQVAAKSERDLLDSCPACGKVNSTISKAMNMLI